MAKKAEVKNENDLFEKMAEATKPEAVKIAESKTLTPVQKTKAIFEREDVQARLKEMIGKRASGFVTSVLSAIQSNNMLQNADPNSVYMSAMMAASLDLPINSNLGHAYIIPYNTRQQDGSYKSVAQFQIGYKGFKQLAIRSGQFKFLSEAVVYEGQLIEENPLTGFKFDWSAKSSDKVLGYVSYFKLINGFESTVYLTSEEVDKHASRYSKTYKQKYGLWNTDRDKMALKTVTKLNLSKNAPLSIEMQRATISDQAIIKDFEDMDSVEYPDNPKFDDYKEVDPMTERISTLIDNAKSQEDLVQLSMEAEIPQELEEKFNEKLAKLTDKDKK